MKENIFFRIGYTTYLSENKKKNWTSKIMDKIVNHKFISTAIFIAIACGITNICLIYRFIYIMEKLK